MLKKNVWIGLLLIVVSLPSTLLAQEMAHGKWWLNERIAEELELSRSERRVLEEMYIESRRNLIDLKSAVERERFELDLLLDTNDMDKKKVLDRYESLERARSELSKERFKMLIDMRETLGAERYQALKAMKRERDSSRKDSKKWHKEDKTNRDRERD